MPVSDHGSIEMVVDDLERLGIGVVDADLFLGELVLEDLIFDALEGERPRCVETHRLQVSGQHFHRRNTAILDSRDELGAAREGKVAAAPETESFGISKGFNVCCAGCRDVDDAGVRNGTLQAKSRPALLRCRLVAALSLAAGGIGHVFNQEFDGMTIEKVSLDELLDVRERFLKDIQERLDDKARTFLLSLHDGDPDFEVIGLPHALALPAVRWKILNLQKLRNDNPPKHAEQRGEIERLFIR